MPTWYEPTQGAEYLRSGEDGQDAAGSSGRFSQVLSVRRGHLQSLGNPRGQKCPPAIPAQAQLCSSSELSVRFSEWEQTSRAHSHEAACLWLRRDGTERPSPCLSGLLVSSRVT